METFVVRVWRPADDSGGVDEIATELRGTILHPASGSEEAFTSGADLLRRLQARSGAQRPAQGTAVEGDAV
jgi:hypothetical protein